MDYLSARRGEALTNGPFDITYEDIRNLWQANERDIEECRCVTESTDRGETYYSDHIDGVDGMANFRFAFYKEVLYRDQKSSGTVMKYPHGIVIRQGERNSYYRGENQQYPKSQPTLFRQIKII